MNRPLLAVVSALALTLVVPACSTTNPDAATVNGVHINRTSFESDLHTLTTNEAFLKATDAAQAQGGQPVRGVAAGSIDKAFAAGQLANLVVVELIHAEVVKRKITPNADQVKNGENVAKGLLNIPQPTDPANDPVWTSLPQPLRDKYTAKGADFLALQGALSTDDELNKLYETVKDKVPETLCASHILVATEEDANAALADIKAGKSFADVATARSTDKGSNTNGGSLIAADGTCPDPASFVPEFTDAARKATVGVPTAPVKTQFGYHIILVNKPVGRPTAQDLHTQLTQYAAQKFIGDSAKAAVVTVDPHYGTWDGTKGTIASAVTPGTATVGAPTTAPGTTVLAAGQPATTAVG